MRTRCWTHNTRLDLKCESLTLGDVPQVRVSLDADARWWLENAPRPISVFVEVVRGTWLFGRMEDPMPDDDVLPVRLRWASDEPAKVMPGPKWTDSKEPTHD